MIACKNNKPPNQIIVDLQPLNNFSKEKVKLAQQTITENYGFKVQVLADEKIPADYITRRKGYRYKARKIIAWLNKRNAKNTDYTVGLTSEEICIDKKNKLGVQKLPEYKYRDWAVFGLGYIARSGCVVSSKRLGSGALGNKRFQKVVLHELGHNLGLPHCPNQCLMADAAESISTVDKVPMQLCSNCKSKL